jgi:hypothetical protein
MNAIRDDGDPSTWDMPAALREVSQVSLLIFTPSELLRGTGIFF